MKPFLSRSIACLLTFCLVSGSVPATGFSASPPPPSAVQSSVFQEEALMAAVLFAHRPLLHAFAGMKPVLHYALAHGGMALAALPLFRFWNRNRIHSIAEMSEATADTLWNLSRLAPEELTPHSRMVIQTHAQNAGIAPTTRQAHLAFPRSTWDLVRRIHPYTLHALNHRDRFALHYLKHEGAYYALWAEKLMGRLPEGGVPIINFDSHPDYEDYSKPELQPMMVGVNDADWAYAAVRDGLAPYVIQISMHLQPYATLIVPGPKGMPQRFENRSLKAPEFRALLDKYVRSGTSPWVSVDVDFFSVVHNGNGFSIGGHVNKEQLPGTIRDRVLAPLAALGLQPSRLVTAVSPDYLAPKADIAYVNGVLKELDRAFAPFNHKSHAHASHPYRTAALLGVAALAVLIAHRASSLLQGPGLMLPISMLVLGFAAYRQTPDQQQRIPWPILGLCDLNLESYRVPLQKGLTAADLEGVGPRDMLDLVHPDVEEIAEFFIRLIENEDICPVGIDQIAILADPLNPQHRNIIQYAQAKGLDLENTSVQDVILGVYNKRQRILFLPYSVFQKLNKLQKDKEFSENVGKTLRTGLDRANGFRGPNTPMFAPEMQTPEGFGMFSLYTRFYEWLAVDYPFLGRVVAPVGLETPTLLVLYPLFLGILTAIVDILSVIFPITSHAIHLTLFVVLWHLLHAPLPPPFGVTAAGSPRDYVPRFLRTISRPPLLVVSLSTFAGAMSLWHLNPAASAVAAISLPYMLSHGIVNSISYFWQRYRIRHFDDWVQAGRFVAKRESSYMKLHRDLLSPAGELRGICNVIRDFQKDPRGKRYRESLEGKVALLSEWVKQNQREWGKLPLFIFPYDIRIILHQVQRDEPAIDLSLKPALKDLNSLIAEFSNEPQSADQGPRGGKIGEITKRGARPDSLKSPGKASRILPPSSNLIHRIRTWLAGLTGNLSPAYAWGVVGLAIGSALLFRHPGTLLTLAAVPPSVSSWLDPRHWDKVREYLEGSRDETNLPLSVKFPARNLRILMVAVQALRNSPSDSGPLLEHIKKALDRLDLWTKQNEPIPWSVALPDVRDVITNALECKKGVDLPPIDPFLPAITRIFKDIPQNALRAWGWRQVLYRLMAIPSKAAIPEELQTPLTYLNDLQSIFSQTSLSALSLVDRLNVVNVLIKLKGWVKEHMATWGKIPWNNVPLVIRSGLFVLLDLRDLSSEYLQTIFQLDESTSPPLSGGSTGDGMESGDPSRPANLPLRDTHLESVPNPFNYPWIGQIHLQTGTVEMFGEDEDDTQEDVIDVSLIDPEEEPAVFRTREFLEYLANDDGLWPQGVDTIIILPTLDEATLIGHIANRALDILKDDRNHTQEAKKKRFTDPSDFSQTSLQDLKFGVYSLRDRQERCLLIPYHRLPKGDPSSPGYHKAVSRLMEAGYIQTTHPRPGTSTPYFEGFGMFPIFLWHHNPAASAIVMITLFGLLAHGILNSNRYTRWRSSIPHFNIMARARRYLAGRLPGGYVHRRFLLTAA